MSLWLFIILALILIFILVLFFSHIVLRITWNDRIRRGSLKWLAGSLYLDFSTGQMGFQLFKLEILKSTPRKKGVPVKKVGKSKKLNYIVLWKQRALLWKSIKIVFRSFIDLTKKARLEKFMLDLRIATPDPALTGMLYAGLLSISYPLRFLAPEGSYHFYPDFVSATPKANLETSLRIGTLNAFWIAARTFFLLPKISLFKMARKLNKKRR